MSRIRFTVVHWKRVKSQHNSKEGNAACKPLLRVPEANTTTNVARVTCKLCKRAMGI